MSGFEEQGTKERPRGQPCRSVVYEDILTRFFFQVRSSKLDWWHMRIPHDPLNLAFLGQVWRRRSAQHHVWILWHQHSRFCELLPFLAGVLALPLVPSTSNQTPLHGESLCSPYGWRGLLHLGNRTSQRNRSHCPPRRNGIGKHTRMGDRLGHHVRDCQLRYSDRQ